MIDFAKVKTVISHEYMTRVKTKGFIIGTILGPLAMLLIMLVPAAIMWLSMDSTHERIAVLDFTAKYDSAMVATDAATFYATEASVGKLSDSVRADLLDGYVVIDSNFIKNATVVLSMKGSAGISLNDKVMSVLEDIRKNELLRNYGIDQSTFTDINKSVTIKQIKISKEKGEKNEAGNSEFQIMLAYIVGFAIYMMLILYGSIVMRGVIEEKTSRIVEVLAASIKPFDFMLGKVVGIGLVGMTQMVVWVFGGGLIMMLATPVLQGLGVGAEAVQSMAGTAMPAELESGFVIPSISIGVLLAMVFFFIVGYFMYATLYAAVASAVDREDDANQIATPLMLLIVIPFLLMSSVMADPNGLLATLISLFPFFSPMLMLARIIVTDGQIPVWQIALSVVLCIATFMGCLWVSARIYRVGILMYGKKPTFKMLWKWIRQAD